MSDASPPSWVKRAPGLSAAHKFMLGVLWGYGPYAGRDELWMEVDGDRQPRQPVQCWESCAELAKLTDQPEATVRNQLRKLAADGWILRGPGSMRTLAWREPRRFAYGAMATRGRRSANEDQGPATGDPGHECTAGGHECIGGVHSWPPKVATDGPQTLQEHSNSTSRNTPGAGAPEDASGPDGGARSEPDEARDRTPSQDHPSAVPGGLVTPGSDAGPADDQEPGRVPSPAEPSARGTAPTRGSDDTQRRRGRRDDPGDGRGAVADAPAPLRLIPAEADGDAVAQLRAEHERLRSEALAKHGKPRRKLPGPDTAVGKAMDRDIRRRFAEHGLEVCRAVLAWRASQWTRSGRELRYSRAIVWEPKGFELALANLDAQPSRSRPSAGLAAAPATLPLVPRELDPEEMGAVL